MDLNEREWSEFIIGELFEIVNSKPLHKNQLESFGDSTLPYITRTINSNGLELFVEDEGYSKNPSNTIVFGAESATFFYEPFEYITGNKMYYIVDDHFNKYVCLFLVSVLNNVVKLNFGYSRGLTGNRLKKQRILLPVNDDNLPDYEFMENFMRIKEADLLSVYVDYLDDFDYGSCDSVGDLSDCEWKEFYVKDVFDDVQRGKRLTKANFIDGDVPYVSSSAESNGIDAYVGNSDNVRCFDDCLTLANSGSVGSTFYHPYEFVASDHVTHLKNDGFSKYVYLFIASILKRLDDKYNFNREINDGRLSNEKIVLPVDESGDVDYLFIEEYMKCLEGKAFCRYLDYLDSRE